MSIYIFSRPIHSGKTSELFNWCNQQKNIAGVLMPDIDGSRKIYDIATKTVFDIECTDRENNKESLITVGRFHFYTAAFEKANSILINVLAQKPGWLVIDEAGKLELEGKGFYSAIQKAIGFYSHPGCSGNLLIAVRDSLCSEAIAFFKMTNYRIIQRLEEIS
jgi:nucleoside-triphosphatase THEP1